MKLTLSLKPAVVQVGPAMEKLCSSDNNPHDSFVNTNNPEDHTDTGDQEEVVDPNRVPAAVANNGEKLAAFDFMDNHVFDTKEESSVSCMANPAVVPALPTLINLESAFGQRMNKVSVAVVRC